MVDLPRELSRGIRKAHGSSDPFEEVRDFYNREIDDLFQILLDDSLSDSIRFSLRKYLIVVIFAALDYFFRNAVRDLIDNNDLGINSLFPPNSQRKLDRVIKEGATTKGNIVASTYSFVDINEIDFVFSNLLEMNSFLGYIIKLNDVNQTRTVLDGHPIPIEYEKLAKAYKLRNDIAHEIKTVKVSKSMVIALWDNLRNILDISNTVLLSVSDLNLRRSLNSEYRDGKKRQKENPSMVARDLSTKRERH